MKTIMILKNKMLISLTSSIIFVVSCSAFKSTKEYLKDYGLVLPSDASIVYKCIGSGWHSNNEYFVVAFEKEPSDFLKLLTYPYDDSIQENFERSITSFNNLSENKEKGIYIDDQYHPDYSQDLRYGLMTSWRLDIWEVVDGSSAHKYSYSAQYYSSPDEPMPTETWPEGTTGPKNSATFKMLYQPEQMRLFLFKFGHD